MKSTPRRIAGLVLATVSFLAADPSGRLWAEEAGVPQAYERARKQLLDVLGEIDAMRARWVSELAGQVVVNHPGEPATYTRPEVETRLVPQRDLVSEALSSLDEAREKLRTDGSDASVEAFHEVMYAGVRNALVALWQLHLREAGEQGDGRVQLLCARHRRELAALAREHEEAERRIEASSLFEEEKEQRTLRLHDSYAWRERLLIDGIASRYRAIAADLAAARVRVAGAIWRWEDFAARRIAIEGDVHHRAEAALREEVYHQCDLETEGSILRLYALASGSMDRLILTRLVHDPAGRREYPDLEVLEPLVFEMERILPPSVEDLRRHDDALPPVPASGTNLERTIRMLHGRLLQLGRAQGQVRELERAIQGQTGSTRNLEGLDEGLASFQDALRGFLTALKAASEEARPRLDAERRLDAARACRAAAEAALAKAVDALSSAEGDIWVDTSSGVIDPTSVFIGKRVKSIPYAEAERALLSKLEAIEGSGDVPDRESKVKRLKEQIKTLQASRTRALSPITRKVAQARSDRDAAVSEDAAAVALLARTPVPPDRDAMLRKLLDDADAALVARLSGLHVLDLLDEIELPFPKALGIADGRRLDDGASGEAARDASALMARIEAARRERLAPRLKAGRLRLERLLSDYRARSAHREALFMSVSTLRLAGVVLAEEEIKRVGEAHGIAAEHSAELAALKQLEDRIQRLLKPGNPTGIKLDGIEGAAMAGTEWAWDEMLSVTGIVGEAVKTLKKDLKTAQEIAEIEKLLRMRDPKGVFKAMELASDYAEVVPLIGPVVAQALGAYAGAASSCIEEGQRFQKRILEADILSALERPSVQAPEKRLYTRSQLEELVYHGTESGNEAPLDALTVTCQVQRLMYLIENCEAGAIGREP